MLRLPPGSGFCGAAPPDYRPAAPEARETASSIEARGTGATSHDGAVVVSDNDKDIFCAERQIWDPDTGDDQALHQALEDRRGASRYPLF